MKVNRIPSFKEFYRGFLATHVADEIADDKPKDVPLKDLIASFYVRDLLSLNCPPKMMKALLPESLHHVIKEQYSQLLKLKVRTAQNKLCISWYEVLPSLRKAMKTKTNTEYFSHFPYRKIQV